MHMFVFLFLLLLQTGSLAIWGSPKTILTDPRRMAMVSAFTQPQEPHYTHFLYRVLMDPWNNILYHLAFDSEQNVVVQPHPMALNASAAAITGSGSKSIYLVYQASPEYIGSTKLYFTESLDDGLTWSKPIIIGDVNSKKVDRLYPNILYQEETGRIVLFYVSFFEDNSRRITMVTRPRGSVVFSAERYVYNTTVEDMNHLELTYTREGKHGSVIHLQWCDKSDVASFTDIIYTQSKDNGATWSAPMKLLKEQVSMLFSLAGSQNPMTPVLASTAFDGKMSYLRLSRDAGRTWDDALKYYGYEYKDLAICGDGTMKGTVVFILTAKGLRNTPFYYTTFEVGKDIIEELPPFSGDGTKHFQDEPFIGCYMESKDVIHLVAVAIEGITTPSSALLINHGRFNLTAKQWITINDY